MTSGPERRVNNFANPSIRWLSQDPSTNSRLGDVGYVDAKGSWKPVLNIFDQKGCEGYGIKPLRPRHHLSDYVVRGKPSNTPLHEPIVHLQPGGSYQLINLSGPNRFG